MVYFELITTMLLLFAFYPLLKYLSEMSPIMAMKGDPRDHQIYPPWTIFMGYNEE